MIRKLILASFFIPVLGMLLSRYTINNIHQDVLYSNTIVNNVDVGNYNLEDYMKWIEHYLEFPIEITIGDTKSSFSLKELGYYINMNEVESHFNFMKDKQMLWNLLIAKDYDFKVPIKPQLDVMSDVIVRWLDRFDPIRDAIDASVYFDGQDSKYKISPHIAGSLDRDLILKYIRSQLLYGTQQIEVIDDDFRALANITSRDEKLLQIIDIWNSVLRDITLDVGGGEYVTLSPSDFVSWLSLDEDTLEFSLNKNSVDQFVNQLARTYNTMGGTISFASTTNGPVSISGGNLGWWMHTGNTSNNIIDVLMNPLENKIEASWRQAGLDRSSNPIGNSYVEINLESQHLWLYVNGELKHETAIVTGKPSSPTRQGVFGVTYVERNARLRGPTWDVKVSYWMPFDGDIGLHDATWQSVFGEQRFRQGFGSNGCVNLSLNSAQIIFPWVSAGFPVIIY